MKTKKTLTILILAGIGAFALLAVAGDLEPSGPPASTMKTLDEVEPRIPIHSSDLPLVITEPNSYYFAEDIDFEPNDTHAITIECDDVTIDLMGYTLKGPDSGDKSGVFMSGQSNVEIRNGTIRDFGSCGINENSSTGNSHRVVDMRVVSNTQGISLSGYGHIIKDCTASYNVSIGISVGSGGMITGSAARSNGGWGIYGSNDCTLTDNVAYYNSSYGIYAYYSGTITNNTSNYNSIGIRANFSSLVSGNTVNYNNEDGIEVQSDSVVFGNVCSDNDTAGIQAGSTKNRIEQNHVQGNGIGIDVDGADNLIVKNSAANNTTEYDIVGGNKVGTISTDPTVAGPWDNFDF